MPFVEAIQAAGVEEQNAVRPLLTIREPVRLGNEECWIEARPASPGKTVIQYELDYGSGNPIGRQSLEVLLSPRFFSRSLAASRTFLLQHEAAALQARGLGKRTTFSDLLIFDSDGPVDNELRYPDECVRHKILDMVGDLASGRLRPDWSFVRSSQLTSAERRHGPRAGRIASCVEKSGIVASSIVFLCEARSN